MQRKVDLGAVLRTALDAVADATLAQTGLPVIKQPGASSTRFFVEALPPGLPVMVAHEHEVHLWLEAGNGWVTHETAEEAEELFEVWKDLLSLANRIASGSEASTNLNACGVWVTTDGNELYPLEGSGGRGWRGLAAAWTGWVAGRNNRQ